MYDIPQIVEDDPDSFYAILGKRKFLQTHEDYIFMQRKYMYNCVI